MRRAMLVLLGVLSLALLTAGCGSRGDYQKQKAWKQLQAKSEKQAQNLERQMEQLLMEMARLRQQQDGLNEQVKVVQGLLDKTQQAQRELGKNIYALGEGKALPQQKPAKSGDRDGWHWTVKLFLSLAIILIFYILYRRITGNDEEDDQEEDGFVEENDLGTIRYPGSVSPNPNPPDSTVSQASPEESDDDFSDPPPAAGYEGENPDEPDRTQ